MVNDKSNVAAKETIEVLLKYVKSNPSLGITIGDKRMIDGEGSDVYSAVEKGKAFFLKVDSNTQEW